MTSTERESFDRYLDIVFASRIWVEACTSMLAAFLESVDSTRDNPGANLPDMAPPIVDQAVAIAGRIAGVESRLRETAERHGPAYQTPELGAVLWWAGMALHKATAAAKASREKIARAAWDDAFIEVHALLYETMSATSLVSTAENMWQQMEAEPGREARPN